MTTSTHHPYLLTPDWQTDPDAKLGPQYNPVEDEALSAFTYRDEVHVGWCDFDRLTHQVVGETSRGVPEPRFGDPILYPEEDDLHSEVGSLLFGASDVFLAEAHPALLQYGPNEGAALEKADLSSLESVSGIAAPSLAPVSQSYPTPRSSSTSPSASQRSPTPGTASQPNTCAQCGASFSRARQLQLHTNKHTRPFTCLCGKAHARKKDLDRHMWAHHEADARRLKIPPVRAVCPFPGCGFDGRQDNVQRHIRTKHRQ